MPDYPNMKRNYRQTPYIVQAAMTGNKKIFDMIKDKEGVKVDEVGFIGFNMKKGLIMQNILGAAAYKNSLELVSLILSDYKLPVNNLT